MCALLILFVGLPGILFSQTDSLVNVWKDQTLPDQERLQAIHQLVNEFLRQAPAETTIHYAEIYLKEARKSTSRIDEAQALHAMGAVLKKSSSTDSAFNIYQQELAIWKQLDDKLAMARTINSLAAIKREMGDLQQANELFLSSLKISEEHGYQSTEAYSLLGIGLVFQAQGDLDQAVEYMNRALGIYSQIEDFKELSRANNNIAIIYLIKGEYETSLTYFRKSAEATEASGDKEALIGGLMNLGGLLGQLGKTDEALTYLQRSLELTQELGQESTSGNVFHNISSLYQIRKEYDQSVIYGLQALELARANDEKPLLEVVTQVLYEDYKQLGQSEKALEMYEQYVDVRDSLRSEENAKETTKQRLAYEFDKQAIQDSLTFVQRQTETELTYQKELSKRNLIIFSVLGLGIIAFLFFRNRQQLRNKEKELELIQERANQQRLRELDEMKSTFFTNISHEFRTPLTIILGMADQLSRQFDQERTLIRRNGRRLLRLVNQVLDLARLESDNLQLTLVQGNIVSYLRYLTESFQSLAEEREITLTVVSHIPELIMDYDPDKIQDIGYNLLSNAIKYTPSGGEVTMVLDKFSDNTGQEGISCSIKDTGIGISENELQKVFDRFYQGDNADRESSTGVGLSLVKALLERMGGNITVQSMLGEGSKFRFWLPAKTSPNTPFSSGSMENEVPEIEDRIPFSQPMEIPVFQPERQTVLVIEDNPDVVTYLAGILGPLYFLLTAEDGISGVSIAQERIPDLIVTDVMMPGMNGYEVTQAVKSDEKTSHIPVIMLTAKASQDDKVTGFEFGADAYLVKPFHREELLVRIQKLIEQRKVLKEKFGSTLSIRPEEVTDVPMDQVFLKTVFETIESHLEDDQFGVGKLSEIAGMSVTHLNRKLNALIGQSGGKLIRSLRLKKASELLSQKSATVSEVAYRFGFSDPGNFSKSFKKQFGVSPSEF